jgi:hypothetical protein
MNARRLTPRQALFAIALISLSLWVLILRALEAFHG